MHWARAMRRSGTIQPTRSRRFAAEVQPPFVSRQAMRRGRVPRKPDLANGVNGLDLVPGELVTNKLAAGLLRGIHLHALRAGRDGGGRGPERQHRVVMHRVSAASAKEEQHMDARQLVEGGRGLLLGDAYAAGWGVKRASSPEPTVAALSLDAC